MLSKLFDIEQTGYRIDLLTHKGRGDITYHTINWWESQGWQVVVWDNTGFLPAVGRNQIIEDYKSSDRDYLIMADDDITLYTHRYLTQQWLKAPIFNGVYTLNSNLKMNVLKQYSRDWDCWQQGQHYWTDCHHIGQLYVINRKDIPCQDTSLPALEDMDWAWQCNQLGINTQMLHTVFLREQSQDRGSIFCSDRQQRVELYNQARDMMKHKWGTTSFKEFKQQYAIE